MVNGFRYYRALESVSIVQLCLPLLPFTHARSESIKADSLNSNFLQLGRRSGGRPQQTVHPMRLPVNTVIHTTLMGLEPATFRLLVDCWSDALPVVPPTHRTRPIHRCHQLETDVLRDTQPVETGQHFNYVMRKV